MPQPARIYFLAQVGDVIEQIEASKEAEGALER